MSFEIKKEYIGQTIEDLDFDSRILAGVVFEDCVFKNCNFKDCNLSTSRMIDCKFHSCDLSNISVVSGSFRGLEFHSCKLIGIQWSTTKSFGSVSFHQSNLAYSSFIGLKIKKTTFEECNLRETDFSDADLSESEFEGSDLLGSFFSETVLLKTNFTGAENFEIDPTKNLIKGAKFSVNGALSLLNKFGVIVS